MLKKQNKSKLILIFIFFSFLNLSTSNTINIESKDDFLSINFDWETLINASRIKSDIDTLSSNQFEGRFPGTSGSLLAHEFITDQLSPLNTVPLTNRSDFNQYFVMSPWAQPMSPVSLIINGTLLNYGSDYVEYIYTGNISLTSPTDLYFAGYGIDSLLYNDYGSINVTDKIVVVSHGTPEGLSYEYGFNGMKARSAYEHGANGIIIINHPKQSNGFKKSSLGMSNYFSNLGAVTLNRSVFESFGFNFTMAMNEIDSHFDNVEKYTGQFSTKLNLTGSLTTTTKYLEQKQVSNLLFKFPGKYEKAKSIIISAHIDHLGVDSNGEIYNGADDDASGIATVLEIGRILNELNEEYLFKKTVILAFWDGEESGLLGSYYFTDEDPLVSLDSIDLVIQLDMVGLKSHDGHLSMLGGQYVPTQLYNFNETTKYFTDIPGVLALDGASDHIPFLEKGIPAFGLLWDDLSDHTDYHTPLDTAEKIEPLILEKVTKATLAYLITMGAFLSDPDENTIDLPTDFIIGIILIISVVNLARRPFYKFKKSK